MARQIQITDRINSIDTTIMTRELLTAGGFSLLDKDVLEWPIVESSECPRKAFERLRELGIPVSLDEMEEEQPDPDERMFRPETTVIPIDVLGRYYNQLEQIVLFTRIIEKVADELSMPEDILREVVMAHEIAHAITHRAKIGRSEAWQNFGLATSESKELLAQLIPCIHFQNTGEIEHSDVMETLSQHQEEKYQSYKEVEKSVKSKTALPKLVNELRQVQSSRAKCLPKFQPEWQIDYWRTGNSAYSIRQSGVVFYADTLAALAQPLKRGWINNRVPANTLTALETEIKDIIAAVPSQNVPRKKSDKSPEVIIRLRYDYGTPFVYAGRPQVYDPARSYVSNFFAFSSGGDDWGNYPKEISEFSGRVRQLIAELSKVPD